MPGLPAPAKGGSRHRGRPAAQQAKRGKGRKAARAASEESEDTEMAEASGGISPGTFLRNSCLLVECALSGVQLVSWGACSEHCCSCVVSVTGESVGGTPGPEDAAGARGGQPGSSSRQPKPAAGRLGRAAAAAEDKGGASGAESAGGRTAAEEDEQQLAPRTKKFGSDGSGKRAAAPRSRPAAGTPSRQQPRRGAKAEAAGKLRDQSSEEGEEEAGSSQGTEAGEEAPRGQRLQQPQQIGQKQEHCVAHAAALQRRNLRADTEDEEWEDEEKEPAQPSPRSPASAQQPTRQQPKKARKQQQQQGPDSSGQENRAGSNAAAAAGHGGVSKPASAGKGKAPVAPGAKGRAAVKSLLKRARA